MTNSSFLPQAAADDGIVAVQTQGQRLTIQDFLANVVLSQALQLPLGGPLPGAGEDGREIFNLSLRDDNFIRSPPVRSDTRL
ncbi:MAG: hypothetical protein ACREX4_10620 [Gammaproteobacteria bacterium]